MIDLILKDVADQYVRENFSRLLKFFRKQAVLKTQLRHVEITVPRAITNFRFKHNLGFLPKDVIPTSVIGAGAVTWNYSLFDNEFLDLTTTDEVVVRAFVGTYREDA